MDAFDHDQNPQDVPQGQEQHIQSEWGKTGMEIDSSADTGVPADTEDMASDTVMATETWTGEFSAERTKPEVHAPAVGNQSLEDWILEPLEPARSTDFLGPKPRYVQFVLANNERYPTITGINRHGASVLMKIVGRPVAPKIVFDIFVRDMRNPHKGLWHPVNLVHRALLEFDLHQGQDVQKREVSDLVCTPVFSRNQNGEYCDPCYIDVKFTTTGGISAGLKVANNRIDNLTMQFLDMLFTATSSHSQEKRQIHFQVPLKPEDVEHAENLLQVLQAFAQSLPWTRAWFPYRSNAGNIRCQAGQLVPRAQVAEYWDGQLCAVPATNHFHDIEEASVKLTYGADLDHRVGTMQFQRVVNTSASVAFVVYNDSVVYAVVYIERSHLNDGLLPFTLRHTDLMIADSTRVEIALTLDNHDSEIVCRGLVVPDHAGIGDGQIHVAIYGRRMLRFKDILSVPGQRLRYIEDVALKFEENEAPLRRQINALSKLREDPAWHMAFLNHEPRLLSQTNPFDGLDPQKVQEAFQTVLNLKAWNEQQQRIFHMASNLTSRIGLVEGFPGCGKSTTLAALVVLYHLAGLHVLIVGPSNASVDAITQRLGSLTRDAGSIDIDYVRVRQARLEGVVSADGPDEEEVPSATASRDSVIAAMLQDAKESYHRRIAGDPKYTVFEHVKRRATTAMSRGEKLMIARQVDGVTGDEFDAYGYFWAYFCNPPPRPADKAAGGELAAWKEGQAKFRRAYNEISEVVVKEAKIVACTDNLAGSDLVRKNFATDPENPCKGIIIIADEDGQAVEPNAWIPLVSLNQAELVKGTIRGGDRHQLPPLVASAFTSPGLNEFGEQLGRSLFDRLLQAGFPSCMLNVQHRMHPYLAEFPSTFTYNGLMKTDSSLAGRTIRPALKAGLVNWLKSVVHAPMRDPNLHLMAIDVTNGEDQIEPRTKSRYNLENVAVVMELLSHLFDSKALSLGSDVTIITPYTQQRSYYVSSLINFAAKKRIAWRDIVKVATVDSMQGHEAECVILDWVVTSAESIGDLGFTIDNNRCNVAITRAKECLIVVGKGRITGCAHKLKRKRDGDAEPESKPIEIVEHWKHLYGQDVVYEVTGDVTGSEYLHHQSQERKQDQEDVQDQEQDQDQDLEQDQEDVQEQDQEQEQEDVQDQEQDQEQEDVQQPEDTPKWEGNSDATDNQPW